MKSRLDPSQYSQFLKCYSFNIDICIKLLNSVIFVGVIKARISFSFFYYELNTSIHLTQILYRSLK